MKRGTRVSKVQASAHRDTRPGQSFGRQRFPNPSAIQAEKWPEAHMIMRQLFETRDMLRLYAEVCGRWERN